MLLNEQLAVDVGNKILKEAVTEQDFDDVFQAFEEICNSDEILLFTLKGYSESFQFVFDEYSYLSLIHISLSAGLSTLRGQFTTNYPVLMAGSMLAMVPMVILYLAFQKQFIEGIAMTGGK